MNEPQSHTVTPNQRLAGYQRCEGLLIEELEFILVDDIEPVHCPGHRIFYDRIKQFCPNRGRLLKAVARGIIQAAKDERNTDGKED